MDSGILVLRVVFGLVMAAHGAQKLFGWFGGHGLAGVGGYFESLGFRPGASSRPPPRSESSAAASSWRWASSAPSGLR